MKKTIYYVLIFGVLGILGFLGWKIIGNTDQTNPIQNQTWKWVSVTDQSTGVKTDIPNPGKYTIFFSPDGTLNGMADCNTFSGTYSLDNGLTVTIGTSTQALCDDGSLDQQYMSLLSSIVAGGPDGIGGMALETAGGAQRMVFK